MLQWTSLFFFFNDTATTEIYTLSLHDALPIYHGYLHIACARRQIDKQHIGVTPIGVDQLPKRFARSEEHTSELQSHSDLVCRLLLEKKKNL